MKPIPAFRLARDRDGGAVLRETLREQIKQALGDLDADVSVFEPMAAHSSILRKRVYHQADSNRGGS
jgi:hypothetical protein